MTIKTKDADITRFASPPCYLHELSSEFGGVVDTEQLRDVSRWRKAERVRLIGARLATSAEERDANAVEIARDLNQLIPFVAETLISVYWPIRGEPDLRPWLRSLSERGVRIALPVIAAMGKPLSFREWGPGTRLARGIGHIPYPADGPFVLPTVVIAPVVGFDVGCFRLGYGAGFFDRTLASLKPRPLAIGVGHSRAQLATIFPQSYDVPMDWIVTGIGRPIGREGRRHTPPILQRRIDMPGASETSTI